MIRALLFAKATAAMFLLRRAISLYSQLPGSVFFSAKRILTNDLPLDQGHLPDMREIEVFIQRCTPPDATDINSTVIRRRDFDEIWFLPILEK